MKKYFLDILDEDFDKKFRRKQLIQSVFSNGIIDFNEISNFPLSVKENLNNKYKIVLLEERDKLISSDGTVKFLFELEDKNFIESVFLIDKNNRVTFCISSQVGCRMGCVFCQTGKMGLVRNLTAYEILSQVIFLYSYMKNERNIDDRLFNIVFMGMGEPLDNIDEVINSIKYITDKNNFGLSSSRITISTCGLVDSIDLILSTYPNIRIAVSLNSAIQSEREKIMPVSKKYSVSYISDKLKELFDVYKTRITLEYVLIKNFNDTENDIQALNQFKNDAFHINIIPLNHSDEQVTRPDEKTIKDFTDTLEKKGFCVTRRYRRGDDIKADCGQLYYSNLIKSE